MALSAAQRFLVGANRASGAGDYFRWHDVGVALGYSDAQSDQAMRSLQERKMIILLQEGNARLLTAGRQLALRLVAKAL